MTKQALLIGVDVGGTNTDSVLINPSLMHDPSKAVLAWNKSVTTKEVSDGIQQGISKLFETCSDIDKHDITSVTIGTTHFINAVIEQDSARLEKVAALRLCGPYSKTAPPFSDFPKGLSKIMNGHIGYLNGGFHVDGNEIRSLDESEIAKHIEEIKAKKIKCIAVIGVFAPMNSAQEVQVKDIILKLYPEAKVVMSHKVSGMGFLERDNATIMNASILPYAEKIISSFQNAIKGLGLSCPVLLTQNDGTVLSATEALSLPIRTFSSGATNSMRGASFLGDIQGQSTIVVDVGGTTADVGLLLPSGFPRQSGSFSMVGGVRTNFSMPHVESIGLGGGSIVRGTPGNLTVGPDSVGSEIVEKALIFGGSETTASDLAVAIDAESETSTLRVGDASLVKGKFSKQYQASFKSEVKKMLEKIIDRMKTSPEDLPVLAVGGGSFIVPEKLGGASKVILPPFYSVANAIGAALGKISSEVHSVEYLAPGGGVTKDSALETLKQRAIKEAIDKGALESSIEIAFISAEPVTYVTNTYEFFIKTIADVDYSRVQAKAAASILPELAGTGDVVKKSSFAIERIIEEEPDYAAYKPQINEKRQWIISNVDLQFMSIGCYIMGCGGGGNPYARFLVAHNYVRNGDQLVVVDIDDIDQYVKDEGSIISVGYAGSPHVSHEQPSGDALMTCYKFMAKYLNKEPELVFPTEIGGGNGSVAFQISSASRLNLPVVDCDLMGRAYPTHWQTLPVVFTPKDEAFYPPTVIDNGNGNTMIIPASKSDLLLEKVMRASLAEIGSTVGCMNPPMTVAQVRERTVHRSMSMAWRIGRAVKISRQKSDIEILPQVILDSINGAGKLLFKGKIIDVERRLFKGHTWGKVIIEQLEQPKQKMYIPFKNENIYAEIENPKDKSTEVVCSVPDLISVVDADNGEAVGTSDYRYGLLVFVLGMAPSNKWTDTERGVEVGGPKGFGLDDMIYKPISTYVRPISVIDEYGPKA